MHQASTINKTVDYVGNKVYENNILKRILVDGGYIEGGKYYFFVTDHLGSNRVVADASGNAIQQNHFYPFGLSFAESTRDEKQPNKYTGMELDPMHGLALYDYISRMYDSQKGRFDGVDAHAENYYGWSPYVYVGKNPTRLTDPTGMDWYQEEDGTYQYDPELTKKNQTERLQKGQVYTGATHQIKDNKGNIIANYRKDGSIMHANEKDAYSRAITNSEKTGNEEAVAILDNGALVAPNYKNDPSTSLWGEYGYSFEGVDLKDPVLGSTLSLTATAHTHPSGNEDPSTWTGTGYGDLAFASKSTPYKPAYVLPIGKNNVSFIYAAPNAISSGNYLIHNVTQGSPSYNMRSIQTNSVSLRQFTKSNKSNFRKVVK